MPCRGPEPTFEEIAAGRAAYEARWQERIDALTRLLCQASQILDDDGYFEHDHIEEYGLDELAGWHHEHVVKDKQRKSADALFTTVKDLDPESIEHILAFVDDTVRLQVRQLLQDFYAKKRKKR